MSKEYLSEKPLKGIKIKEEFEEIRDVYMGSRLIGTIDRNDGHDMTKEEMDELFCEFLDFLTEKGYSFGGSCTWINLEDQD
jgi:hypothetical protein